MLRASRDPLRKRASKPTRALIWCSGVDADLLDGRQALMRQSSLGLLVVLVAAGSAAMLIGFLTTVQNGFALYQLAVAAAWFLLIFSIDRSILADITPDEKRTGFQAAVHHARRAPLYALRVAVSLAVAAVVAEIALLMLFQSEIQAELAHSNVAATTQDQKAAAEDRAAMQEKAEASVDYARRCDPKALQEKQNEVVRLSQALDDEKNGTPGRSTGQPGFKGAAQALERQLNAARASQDAAVKDCDEATTAVADTMRNYDDQQAEPTGDAADAREADHGWVSQEAALGRVLAQRRADGGWLVVALPWLLRIILFALDLMPLALKLATSSRGSYTAAMGQMATLHEKSRENTVEVGKKRLDIEREVAERKADADRDLQFAEVDIHAQRDHAALVTNQPEPRSSTDGRRRFRPSAAAWLLRRSRAPRKA